MNDPQIPPTAPALGISVQCTAGDSVIVFQTHVEQETDDAALNTLLDRLTKAAARQKAKAELPALEQRLKTETAQLMRLREDRMRIEATLSVPQEGRRNQNRNDADLKMKREQADATEKRYGEIIAEINETIAATQALIAGG